MNRPNHAYFARLSHMAVAQRNYDRMLPPDDECHLSTSEIDLLEELRVEGIIDARESRERGDW